MADISSMMAMLQHGDSFFPSGTVSFSWGLEGLVARGRVGDAASVADFISGQLHGRWASFDRPVVVAAYRATPDLPAIAEIDAEVEVQSPVAESRLASRRLGGAMLSVFDRLGLKAAALYRSKVKSGSAPGHLSLVQGYLWASLGHDEIATQLLSAHTFCTGLAGAAIRLGCIGHIAAQRILGDLRSEVGEITRLPVASIWDLSSCAVEAEIAIIHNAFQDSRLFMT